MTWWDIQSRYQQTAMAYSRAMITLAPPAEVHAARTAFLAAQAAWLALPKRAA